MSGPRSSMLGASSPASLQAVRPVLVFAVGNPSRGDDAVGPMLAERLEAQDLPDVEVLVDWQLQVEHALDLEGRARVVFVDAWIDADSSVALRKVEPDARFAHTSHALHPAQVLETYRRVTRREPPEAWLLGVRAERFELGAGLSPVAIEAVEQAWPRLLEFCARPVSTRCARARSDPNSPP